MSRNINILNGRAPGILLIFAAGATAAMLIIQTLGRAFYPWDYVFWREGVFMANMQKLTAGGASFGDPADANSTFASPSLEYICYVLLSPLRWALDIRACRIVSIALCAAGCAAATFAFPSVAKINNHSAGWRAFAFTFLLLVAGSNPVFDSVFSDNLQIAFCSVLLLLLYRAADHSHRISAAAAAVLSGAGYWISPLAGLAWLGVGGYLLYSRVSRRNFGAGLLLFGLAAASAAVAFMLLSASPNARYFSIDGFFARPVEYYKTPLLLIEFVRVPQHAVLAAAGCFFITYQILDGDPLMKRYFYAWLALAPAAAPSLLEYLMISGEPRRCAVFDFWMAMLVVPSAMHLYYYYSGRSRAAAGGIVGLGILTVILLFPRKVTFTRAQYQFGENIENEIRGDIEAKRRVLLPFGSSAAIRLGLEEAPLDRVATIYEMGVAGRAADANIIGRLESRYYDKILYGTGGFGTKIEAAIFSNYKIDHIISGDQRTVEYDESQAGSDGITHYYIQVLTPIRK